ncbi:NAD-dependent epimerase/dehydratase family protein [Noviherbaspirillum sp. ST9]|uniref:NAD-dependent epimerase/dehydratase family protein n=1 Tax=Noviherbaspirillum sp. ST9 TaxID=3401606 RepID=UPI003B589FC7
MKYTVLGASGFIGRHLVAALVREGHQVYAPPRGSAEIFEQPLGHVLYCIGLTADFRTRPFDTVRAHVTLLGDVLEKAEFESLLYLSSTRVYARSSSGTEQANIPVDVHDPSDLYNITKLAGESLCRSCGRTGVKIARLSNVIGKDTASENFLFALIREALSGRILLQSDPASSKDYILLEDVVSLLPRIAVSGNHFIYNVASGRNLAHTDIVEALMRLTSCQYEVLKGSPRHDFPAIDIARIRTEFGFSPSSVLDQLPTLLAEAAKGKTIPIDQAG